MRKDGESEKKLIGKNGHTEVKDRKKSKQHSACFTNNWEIPVLFKIVENIDVYASKMYRCTLNKIHYLTDNVPPTQHKTKPKISELGVGKFLQIS